MKTTTNKSTYFKGLYVDRNGRLCYAELVNDVPMKGVYNIRPNTILNKVQP